MTRLPFERIHELHAAAARSDLALRQPVLFDGIDRTFFATLPDLPDGSPYDRLLRRLFRLNDAGVLADGTFPLKIWLSNAARLIKDDVFTEAIAELTTGARGFTPPPPLPRVDADATPDAKIRALFVERARLAASGQPTDELLAQILKLKRDKRARADFNVDDQIAGGRYQLLERVGRGGIGTVWKALDHLRGEFVAIKVLHEYHGTDLQLRFRRGARYMSKLNHPNVVRVIQTEGVEELSDIQRWYFVMDYLPGGDFKRGVLAGRWTPEDALRLLIDVGAGLHRAHEQGMVHRDVSPDNILIGADGAALLTDFDLVRAPDTTGLTSPEQAFGKFLYVAPELFESAAEADARADVYALGMMAIFALHGRELPATVMRAFDRFVAELECSEPVREVLRQATAWEREARYEDAGEMCGELYLALKESEPPARVEISKNAPKPADADMLSACRVYFTEFDRITYARVAWTADEVDEIAANLKRKLKLLGLIKGHVLVPASHLLESELARELVLAHPVLLSSRVLVPVLRSDAPTCKEFLEAKLSDPDDHESSKYEGAEPREVAQLIDQEARVERWDAAGTIAWYRERLLSDIDDDRSLLRSSLRAAGLSLPNDFRGRIADTPTLSRNAVYRAAGDPRNGHTWELLRAYSDFIYYLGGARAVRSEGVLPQENLVDFSKTEILRRTTRLSDMEVFFKLFADVVKAATSAHFPADLLDGITIKDVVDLHSHAVSARFVEAYDRIQAKTKEGLLIQDPERLVLLMDELEAFELDLHRNIEDSVRRELASRRRKSHVKNEGRSAHSIASLLVPYHDDGLPHDVVVSGLQVTYADRVTDVVGRRIQDSIETCQALVERDDLPESPVLLPFVEKLRRRYADKLLGRI